jgi:hypothetical protein
VEARPRPAIQLEPEVLAVPVHADDAAAPEGAPHAGRRDALEHDGVVGAPDAGDAAAAGDPSGQEPGGLDLGQFGHGRSPDYLRPPGHLTPVR